MTPSTDGVPTPGMTEAQGIVSREAPQIVLDLWAYGAPNSNCDDPAVIDRAAACIEDLVAALEAIHAACDEEIKTRFRTSSHKTEEELGRNSAVYSLLVIPRNIARQALARCGSGE
jgi:hypothetical protein